MTQIPSDDILEGLYKLRIRESEKLKTVLELHNMEIHQKKARPAYHRLKTMVKRSIEQNLRIKNFEARNGNYERNAVVENQGTKQRVQRILGDCWQWEANGQCSKGDNWSFRHDINKRGKSTQPNASPSSSTRQNNASRTRSPRGKSLSGKMFRLPCIDYLKGTCTNSFCEKWHPPECLFYKSENGCRFGEKCSDAHRQVEEQPSKRSKKNGDKSAVAMLKKYELLVRTWQPVVNRDESHDRSGQPVVKRDTRHELKHGLGADHRIHDNWVAYFRTWSRRSWSQSYGRAQTCRNQCNVWNSRKLLHVTLKFETKILRSYIFAQVNLISAAPTLQNLRIGLRRSPRSSVQAGQKWV